MEEDQSEKVPAPGKEIGEPTDDLIFEELIEANQRTPRGYLIKGPPRGYFIKGPHRGYLIKGPPRGNLINRPPHFFKWA